MKPTLPRDVNSSSIQALFPVATVNLSISSGGQVRGTLPDFTDLVRIAVNQDCYVEFGGSGVVATTSSMFFPIGAEVFACTDNGITHVSILGTQVAAGIASVSKMV